MVADRVSGNTNSSQEPNKCDQCALSELCKNVDRSKEQEDLQSKSEKSESEKAIELLESRLDKLKRVLTLGNNSIEDFYTPLARIMLIGPSSDEDIQLLNATVALVLAQILNKVMTDYKNQKITREDVMRKLGIVD